MVVEHFTKTKTEKREADETITQSLVCFSVPKNYTWIYITTKNKKKRILSPKQIDKINEEWYNLIEKYIWLPHNLHYVVFGKKYGVL